MALTASTTTLPIAARAGGVEGRARGPPPAPSGGGAAASSRVRPGGTTLPWLSAMTWISMWRGLLEVALHVDRVVAEGGLGLGLGGLDGLDQVVRGLGHLHAAPAAAGRGLDQHREADGLGRRDGLLLGRRPRRRSRARTGMPASFTACLAVILSPIIRMCSGLGPMKVHAVGFDDLGEAGVLRQEAVAGVDGLGAGDLGGGDDRGDVQIALGRGRPGRCRRSRRPGAPTWRRGRPRSARPRWRCPSPCRRGGCAGRSRRGWRSGSCRTSALLEHDERLAELHRLGVARPGSPRPCRRGAPGSGSWSSWPRRSAGSGRP